MRIRSTARSATLSQPPQGNAEDGEIQLDDTVQDDGIIGDLDPHALLAPESDDPEARLLRKLRAEIISHLPHRDLRSAKTIALIGFDDPLDLGRVAANLGASFAANGEHTLLIEADIAAVGEDSLFNVSADFGLFDAIEQGHADNIEILPTTIGNLHILPSGHAEGTRSERENLIERHVLTELLDPLIRRYSYAVIALNGVSTGSLAAILPGVDVLVPVVKRGVSRKRDLKEFLAIFDAMEIFTCGIVLSD